MMGSTVKLLGLASANVFIALALSAGYLTHYSGKMQTLSNETAAAFVREFSAIKAGQRSEMDDHAQTAYLMKHVADDGAFTKTLNSQIPGVAKVATAMKKKEFIMEITQIIRQKGPHPASVKVEEIKISEDGRTATALAVINEKSAIEIKSSEDDKPSVSAVSATSYCNESVQLSNEHIIQIQSETCTIEVAPIDSF